MKMFVTISLQRLCKKVNNAFAIDVLCKEVSNIISIEALCEEVSNDIAKEGLFKQALCMEVSYGIDRGPV